MPKKKIIDVREFGWTHEKMEGVALIDDKTIAVINDNDFGLRGHKKFDNHGKGIKYEIMSVLPEKRKTELWIMHFDKSFVNK